MDKKLITTILKYILFGCLAAIGILSIALIWTESGHDQAFIGKLMVTTLVFGGASGISLLLYDD